MAGRRLLGLSVRTAAAALSLASHRFAILAGGDAVLEALENPLANPSDERVLGFGTIELLPKLGFKLFDVFHRSFKIG